MSGRHRRNFSLTGIILASATAAVVVIGAGSWVGYEQLAAQDCSGQVKLNVAAAPEIAGAVRTTAQKWMEGEDAQVGGVCVAVSVEDVESAAGAATIAQRHGVTLTGLGAGQGKGTVPDVWLPDSSMWLLRVSSEAPGFVPTDREPIAESPVVLAMPAPIAQKLGWPKKKLQWKDMLATITGGGNALRPGIVDPTRDAAGLAGLLALGGAAGSDAAGTQKKVFALRALAANSSSIRQDLLEKFPRSVEDVTTALSAAPLSEEDVVAFNAGKPPIQLAALYLDPAPAALNYPFAVMPETDPQKQAAAGAFHDVLRGQGFRDALAAAGLRGPDGAAGAGFIAPAGAPAVAAPVNVVPADAAGQAAAATRAVTGINQVLGSWAAITLPGRVLAVFDVSGSMLEKVPTAGNITRAEVTQRAAAQGLALFDDRWAVGTWIFSTDMVGSRPWKELVPITPLTSGRTELNGAISQIIPKPDGDTGLYDTALAAYRNVQDSWQPGRVNSVILFTDGANENPGGLKRGELLAKLKKLRDPKRPVRLVFIGIGTGVDRNELTQIASATSSGGVFIAEDPARISDIFLEAIATRSGA
ncbi:VWA domain-containing protein [Actinoplanes friuliensis]|uniref:VWA domain-containing protein n=1 Tax=Actinoplanes friuliensis TaxID=196914 RepID=UPI001EE68069|nr:VWA domain-containing protein [Actinoplanes friuliensis]